MHRGNKIMDDLDGFLPDRSFGNGIWEPGFEAGRCLVYSKLGPVERIYLRPARFRRRFYHHIYPFPVETWPVTTKVDLHGGLCTMEVNLKIRFQATLPYAEKNPESWHQINHHVRSQMETLILDAVEYELTNLAEGDWVTEGLNATERQMATAINEILALNHVQCRTVCTLKPVFADISTMEKEAFVHDKPFLAILKKQFEFEQIRFRESKQQQEERLRHELEQLRFTLESSRRKQEEEAESNKKRLEAKRRHRAEQRDIEKKLRQEDLSHRSQLEEMEWEQQRHRFERRQQVEAMTLKARHPSQQAADPSSKEEAGQRQGQERFAQEEESDSRLPEQRAGFVIQEETATSKLREKERLIATLEQELEMLRSSRHDHTQLSLGQVPVAHSWLDRLAHLTGRLLFFFRHRS